MISNVLREDLDYILSKSFVPWDKLKNKVVMVTGSTGLIGKNIILVLDMLNRERNMNINIIAHGRNEEMLKKNFAYINNIQYIIKDIIFPVPLEIKVDFIFHCAAITKSSEMNQTPVDVIKNSVLGTINILDTAITSDIVSMVYLSSMEVYGDFGSGIKNVVEDDLGFIPINEVRSCYPQSKRMAENICYCYHTQHGLPVKIARLAQVFGAGAPENDTRIFGDFARKVIENKEIVLHTEGKTLGNYCYLADAILGLFVILLLGENGGVYNVSNNNNSMTIKEMAEMLAKEFGTTVKIQLTNNMGYAPTSSNILNTNKLSAIGWEPRYSLKEMYNRMINDWRSKCVDIIKD